MKRRLVDFLSCPLDGGNLEIQCLEDMTYEQTAQSQQYLKRQNLNLRDFEQGVRTGLLVNRRQNVCYPIIEGVPRLLTFRTQMHTEFERLHPEALTMDGADLCFPNQEAMPGEAAVLSSFSREWVDYDWDGEIYWNLETNSWFECMEFVLDLKKQPIEGKLVLEMGIGIGGVADYVARSQHTEVVGVDLGNSVQPAQSHFGRANPLLHIVQASAFHPPFKKNCFDFLYSFGVLHHTHSTKDAVISLHDLVREGGRLFVWVYSPAHEKLNIIRRLMMTAEAVIRPVVSRLPAALQTVALLPWIPLYMVHQAIRKRTFGHGQLGYTAREALHAARDRFTPRFIHRHKAEELVEWLNSLDYHSFQSISDWDRPPWLPPAFTVSTGVHAVRSKAGNESVTTL